MIPHHRSMHGASRSELRGPEAALPGVAGALLLIRLARGARHLAHALGLVGSRPALRHLPMDHPGDDILARRCREQRVRQFDRSSRLTVQCLDFDLHRKLP